MVIKSLDMGDVMITILFLLFFWVSISNAMQPALIELRDSNNKPVAIVERRTLNALKRLNASFSQRPIEEIKVGTQPTYRLLTGLSKQQIQGMLSQINSQFSSLPTPPVVRKPEPSIQW